MFLSYPAAPSREGWPRPVVRTPSPTRPLAGRCARRRKPVLASFAVLLAALLAFGLAGCGLEDVIPPPASGSIGGLSYIVVQGALNLHSDGSISAGPDGAALIFNARLNTLATDPNHINMQVTFAAQDGGSVAVAAFGTNLADQAGSMGAKTTRTAGTFDYALSWGIDDTPDQVGGLGTPANPDGTLYFTADLFNDVAFPPGSFTLWGLENAAPAACSGAVYSSATPVWGPATGNRVGIGLINSRVYDVQIGDALESGGC